MQTMFKGAISFGLVNIPIKMFTATEEKDIRFRSIHKKCHTPIKYKKICPLCNEEVSPDDIVKGFEYEPGKFVIISGEDIESAKTEVQARTIEIVDFVSLSEIDPIYFDKTYYLAPQPEVTASAKAYSLLRDAMDQSGRIARLRGLSTEAVETVIKRHISKRLWGVFGEPVVNVLEVNLELEGYGTAQSR
jgi:DNA end-binding protein Ku